MFGWPILALFVVFIKLSSDVVALGTPWTKERKLHYRESIRGLWQHGYDSYMGYAFPTDELMPLSCFGRGPDWEDPTNIGTNDVAGNYSLTLVDVLDSLAIMGEQEDFSEAVRNVIDWVSFNVNTKPQVFEVNIRALGSLLSAHMLATDERLGHKLDWYNDELLLMAWDLGKRLLPAFDTPTGLPFARVNLRHGIMINETTETCVAGAGSLILEFGTLTRFTGDPRFEQAARKAFFTLWDNRSEIGLVGNHVDVISGKWGGQETTGIGAGVDSFYEYALKWYILSGEPEFLDVWNEAYGSVMNHVRATDGYSYRTVTMAKGLVASSNVDSLSAFWAGLQVLAGDVQGAIKSHLFYWNLWRKYHAIPELFDTATYKAVVPTYPLRPEFIESTFFLYQATKDTFYLDVGVQIFEDLLRSNVTCGLATVSDIIETRLEDRMESFVLSETLKYLYLLFDEDNPIAGSDSNIIFSTEGHVLSLNQDQLRHHPNDARHSKHKNFTCPAPHIIQTKIPTPALSYSIRERSDYDYARTLVGLQADGEIMMQDRDWWKPYGVCEVPDVDIFSYEFLLSRMGDKSKEDEDVSSLKKKIFPYQGGVIVNEVTGLRVAVRSRFDGRGYDITKIGHLEVKQGETVFINDSLLFGNDESKGPEVERRRAKSVPLKFWTTTPRAPLLSSNKAEGVNDDVPVTSEFVVEASSADFGRDLDTVDFSTHGTEGKVFSVPGVHLVRFLDNPLGCSPYNDPTQRIHGALVFVERGDCLFVEKLAIARQAGAIGIIVWHDGEERLRPSADAADLEMFGPVVADGVIAVIPASAASFVMGRLKLEEDSPEKTVVMVSLEKEWPEQLLGEDPTLRTEPTKTKRSSGRILYINGHPMINTELMF